MRTRGRATTPSSRGVLRHGRLGRSFAASPTTEAAALLRWWSDLKQQATANTHHHHPVSDLKRNIEQDLLAETSANIVSAASLFASRVSNSRTGDAVEDAKAAMNDTANSQPQPCMVCLGPPAQLVGPLVRVTTIGILTDRTFGIFLPFILTDPDPQTIVESFDDAAFQRSIDPNRNMQGYVPVLFWATEAQGEAFLQQPGRTGRELRLFRGLDDPATPSGLPTPRMALLRLKSPEDRYVPTGWDAFQHPLFRAIPASARWHAPVCWKNEEHALVRRSWGRRGCNRISEWQ